MADHSQGKSRLWLEQESLLCVCALNNALGGGVFPCGTCSTAAHQLAPGGGVTVEMPARGCFIADTRIVQ